MPVQDRDIRYQPTRFTVQFWFNVLVTLFAFLLIGEGYERYKQMSDVNKFLMIDGQRLKQNDVRLYHLEMDNDDLLKKVKIMREELDELIKRETQRARRAIEAEEQERQAGKCKE